MSIFDVFRPKKLLREALKDRDFARIEKILDDHPRMLNALFEDVRESRLGKCDEMSH